MFINTIVTSLPRDCRIRLHNNGRKVFMGVVGALPIWIKSHCAKMSPAEREHFQNLSVHEYINELDKTINLYIQR